MVTQGLGALRLIRPIRPSAACSTPKHCPGPTKLEVWAKHHAVHAIVAAVHNPPDGTPPALPILPIALCLPS